MSARSAKGLHRSAPWASCLLIGVLLASGAWSSPPVVQTEAVQRPVESPDYPTDPASDPNKFNPIPNDVEEGVLGRPDPNGEEYKGPSEPSSMSRDLVEQVLRSMGDQVPDNDDQILESPPGPDPVDVVDGDGGVIDAFGALTFENQPWRYPRRVGVKLFMTHGAATRMCSGTLIDALHVLTAAHCMFPTSGTGAGTWPNTIQVVPGYRVINGNGYQPFGTADWTNVFFYTGWTTGFNLNDDVVVVRLDRHIGALTSWFGYRGGGNCGFYTGNTHYSAGYPAGQFESPVGTCNRGRQQFFWQGTFDSCTTNWLGNWTGGQVTFDTESWHGQSGSGMYYLNPQNNRVVTAVLSNGTCSGNNPTCPTPNCANPTASPSTSCVRFSLSRFNDIQGYINQAIPAANDLVPLWTRVTNKCETTCDPAPPENAPNPNCQFYCPVPQVPAGRPLPYLDFVVLNYSSSNFGGAINGRYYLSSTRTITTGNTLIGTFTVNTNLSPRQSVRVTEVNPITIPANTVPGTYYVGVMITTPNANAGNDIVGVQDVAQITVVPSGACCKADGSCQANRTPAECNAPGDIYQGNGSSCTPFPCGARGACCNALTGSCQVLTQAGCANLGLNYQGDGTTCNPNPCPQPPQGACCDLLGSGNCFVTAAANCQNFGQHYQGDNTTCNPNPCTSQPSGACCDIRDGTCSIKTSVQCLADQVHFAYQGDGTPCTPNPCSPPQGGACCDGRGNCSVRLPQECVDPTLIFFGVGTSCNPNPCPPSPPGACCAGDGTCSLMEQEACGAAGGIFRGGFTTCTPNPCQPLAKGACCYGDGSCSLQYQHICVQGGGNYEGDNTDCVNNPCPPMPTGACCDVTGDCLETTQFFCELYGGTYEGDNTDCVNNPCPPVVTGACCELDGTCTDLPPANCDAINGIYMGDGSDCSTNPCLNIPTGSCCDLDGNCIEIPQAHCLGIGGTYLGDNTNCFDNPCPQPATGACCQAGGFCSIRSHASCNFVHGVYGGDGSDCLNTACPCGDFNQDLMVDGADFAALLLAFGTCGDEFGGDPGFNAAVDMDFDGCITFIDYQLWLQCYRNFIAVPGAAPPVPSDVGDMNGDGRVDGLDIQPFLHVMLAPGTASFRGRFVSDFNADGRFDGADLSAMVNKLLEVVP